MSTSSTRGLLQKKEKVTISVDAELLQTVDAHVEESKGGLSRSSVIEQALHLWKQAMRDQFDAKYYAENTETLQADGTSWSAITSAAAKHIWKE
jgi:metal-responsive CopG/Arc/MetJ family transcriptional regulator